MRPVNVLVAGVDGFDQNDTFRELLSSRLRGGRILTPTNKRAREQVTCALFGRDDPRHRLPLLRGGEVIS